MECGFIHGENIRRSKIEPNDRVYSTEGISGIMMSIARVGVERIYLFGSYARGEVTSDSDVDLLIDFGRIDSYLGIRKPYSRLNHALEKNLGIVPPMPTRNS